MADELCARLAEIETDESVRVVILTGAGKAFSSGANLKDPKSHATLSLDETLADMNVRTKPLFYEEVAGFSKPLICAVNEYAIGASFMLALCCDFILASETAQFWMPQGGLGLFPAHAATARLAQWVGRGRAMEIALTGRRVSASEAKEIGLVTAVAPAGELDQLARTRALELAKMPPLGLKFTKESLNLGLEIGSLRLAGVGDAYRMLLLTLTHESQERHANWRDGDVSPDDE
jgi:enoyl-CoA hydratase